MAFDDTDKERLRQLWAVNGTAYAASEQAGDNPVKDIGQQVFETHRQVAALASPVPIQVDAAELAAALAGNATFVAALAEAVTTNLSHRLES